MRPVSTNTLIHPVFLASLILLPAVLCYPFISLPPHTLQQQQHQQQLRQIQSIEYRKQVDCSDFDSSKRNSFVHFISANETGLRFAIRTPWTRYYPTALERALTKTGFKIESVAANTDEDKKNNKKKDDACAWKVLDRVLYGGWQRGDIRFKSMEVGVLQAKMVVATNLTFLSKSDSSLNMRANSTDGFNTSGDQVENANASMPLAPTQMIMTPQFVLHRDKLSTPPLIPIQHDGHQLHPTMTGTTTPRATPLLTQLHRTPSNATLNTIRNVLRITSPSRDISVFLATIIVPIVLLIVVIAALILIANYFTQRVSQPSPSSSTSSVFARHKTQQHRDLDGAGEGIELQEFGRYKRVRVRDSWPAPQPSISSSASTFSMPPPRYDSAEVQHPYRARHPAATNPYAMGVHMHVHGQPRSWPGKSSDEEDQHPFGLRRGVIMLSSSSVYSRSVGGTSS